MLIIVQKIIQFITRQMARVARTFYATPMQKRVKPWFRINGDHTLRLDYPLDERSIVCDLGGYDGTWASDIFAKYRCTIHCFEPVKAFAEKIENRFAQNKKIIVHRCGLAEADKRVSISHKADSSSIYHGIGEEEIQLIKADRFFKENSIAHIDLMKVNIEGGEYDLMEHLIRIGFIKNIHNVQIQFHDFVPHAYERMKNIQADLRKTHRITYHYEFVWENWELIKE